jgi:hypothetical protein
MLLLAVGSQALKFDIQAGSGHDKISRRCIRNFVSKDMLVVVTAIVDGYKGDGMQLNMHVSAGLMRLSLTVSEARLTWSRFRTRQATSTASPRTLPASSAPSSPRTPTPPSTCALRTS